jgi:uncharacterized membrane protein YedE/YeeE
MLRALSSLIAGLIFGLGLVISGMINPAKVQNFLDVTGSWDPSLAFVMGAALVVTGVGFALLRKSSRPLLAPSFQWPTRQDIDPRLVSGSALFGTGWGLAGFCPGPAISAAALGLGPVYIFLAGMVAGIGLWRWLIAGWLSPQATA